MDLDLEAELLARFEPGCLDPDFGQAFLPTFAKGREQLSDTEWRRYGLDADLKLNGSNYGLRFKHKYFDATFNLCLTHDRELAASLGFEIEGQAMNIWQIQGVKGRAAPLRPIKWERALVQYAVYWGQRIGVAEAFIVSVDHNQWTATHGHLDRKRGRLRYDVTARRCGFRPTGDGYYQRLLGKAT